ncbi:MAG: murein L,D-transpeptidase catalytic domain family protein [Myxococcota bacterium]
MSGAIGLWWLWAAGCLTLQQELETLNEHTTYPGLSEDARSAAVKSYACARRRGLIVRKGVLGIIDFSRPSTTPRLWVIDTETGALLHREYVAHGKHSGDDRPHAFSNVVDSKQSSLGVFRTAETYHGKHGYSLRLDGLEAGINDRARERAIVIHGAEYVSEAHITAFGRLGRSWGCPALPQHSSPAIINELKWGAMLVAYYPDTAWLEGSTFLNCDTP